MGREFGGGGGGGEDGVVDDIDDEKLDDNEDLEDDKVVVVVGVAGGLVVDAFADAVADGNGDGDCLVVNNFFLLFGFVVVVAYVIPAGHISLRYQTKSDLWN